MSEGALLIQQATGRILLTTSSLEHNFGYEADELVGRHVSVLNAPDTARETFDRIVEGLRKDGTWQGEIRSQKKDGTCFWTWADIFTFDHSTFGPVWVTVQRDLTEQIAKGELEERLAFQRMVSEVSTTLAKAPTGQPGEAIVRALEHLGQFLDGDRCVLLHFSEDDSIGAGAYEWTRGGKPPGLRAVTREGLRGFPEIFTVRESGRVHRFAHVEEIPSEWGGFRRFIEENGVKSGLAMPLFLGQELLGAVAVLSPEESPAWPSALVERDNIVGQLFANVLGNLKREAGARRLGEELTHVTRVAAMGELTGSLAHELNQPLTAITANAVAAGRFLRRNPPDRDEVDAALTDISGEARRAGEVIRRMRALLEKGAYEHSLLQMNGLVEEVVALLQNEAVLRNTVFELDLTPNLAAVKGDRIQLQQVLMNLLLNSIDATRDHAAAPHKVTIRTTNGTGSDTEVVVVDDGAGFDSADIEQIFDPFYTTKPNGLGMGLSISRSIVEAHSGRLWAEPNPDRGAAFHFSLPSVQDWDDGPDGVQRPIS